MTSNIKLILLIFALLFTHIRISNSLPDSITVYNETFYTDFLPSDSLISINKFANEVNNLVAQNSKNLSSTNYGIGVYSLTNHKWYYSRNLNKLLTPASVTKLYTTFNLLSLKGKSFKIPTEVYYTGKLDSDGTLRGDLIIKGKGDPLFSTNDLEVLADNVRKFGIKKITGNVYADPNFYDEKTERVIYSEDQDVVQATPPITALNIDRNAATIVVSAGNSLGAQPNVSVYPSSESNIIVNNAKISNPQIRKSKPLPKKKKSRGFYEIPHDKKMMTPEYDEIAGDFSTQLLLMAAAGITVSTKLTADGKQQFIINGTIKPNSTFTYQHLLYNPAYTIAGAFNNRLKAGGITITGSIGVLPRNDTTNKSYHFVTKFERPIFDVINIINKESDNYLAEMLFKMTGASYGGEKDNAKRTRELCDSILKQCNIYPDGLMLNDGSGLSRRNLVTVESTVRLLEAVFHSDFFAEYKHSLTLAGVDGTLKKRFHNTLAEANLQAKTGTLRNVSGLAGFITTRSGEELAFAMFYNGPNVGAYKLLENEIGKVISEFEIQATHSEAQGK